MQTLRDAFGKIVTWHSADGAVGDLSALTASIAHEVSLPLSGIVNNANACLLLIQPKPNEADSYQLYRVRRSVRSTGAAPPQLTKVDADLIIPQVGQHAVIYKDGGKPQTSLFDLHTRELRSGDFRRAGALASALGPQAVAGDLRRAEGDARLASADYRGALTAYDDAAGLDRQHQAVEEASPRPGAFGSRTQFLLCALGHGHLRAADVLDFSRGRHVALGLAVSAGHDPFHVHLVFRDRTVFQPDLERAGRLDETIPSSLCLEVIDGSGDREACVAREVVAHGALILRDR